MATTPISSPKTILVTGDASIDWFQTVLPPDPAASDRNWMMQPRILRQPLPGGVFLLADLCERATGGKVSRPLLKESPDAIPYGAMVTTEVELERAGDAKDRLQVRGYPGYAFAPEGASGRSQVDFPVDASEAKVVVIDDAGNGFRDEPARFPKGIKPGSCIVHLQCRPLGSGSLWSEWMHGEAGRACGSNRVLVVDGEDLRRAGEVSLSRALSWERTALEFTGQLQSNPILKGLARCPNLVVLLGTDGALWFRDGKPARTLLYFDPGRLEGGFAGEFTPKGPGIRMAFTAFIAARLAREGITGLGEGIRDGLWAARKVSLLGLDFKDHTISHRFATLDSDSIRSPIESQQGKKPVHSEFAEVEVPMEAALGATSVPHWTILEEKTRARRIEIAREIVLRGNHKAMGEVPDIRFGPFLNSFDRREIEAFSSIRNLLSEYLRPSKPGSAPAPFNIAVFGSPGSGKSFGVKQIA